MPSPHAVVRIDLRGSKFLFDMTRQFELHPSLALPSLALQNLGVSCAKNSPFFVVCKGGAKAKPLACPQRPHVVLFPLGL